MTATTAILRALRWWDLDAVLDLERDLFDDPWTEGVFWSELAEHASRHYIVAVEGDAGDEIVGYAGLAVMGHEAYVQTMAVARSHWGCGLGAALLTDLLDAADRRGVDTVVLEVRADNERAHALYRRFGFTQIGIRKGYYQPSGADAVVMMRRSV